jgi:CheY-like chemotaxis protein
VRPSLLVVEDDPVTRTLLRGFLEAEGYDVALAVDGDEAVDCLDRQRYDAVLLDIVLPKRDGIAVMEHLARHDPSTLERVVVVTGLNIDEVRKLFPAVRNALAKPVLRSRLLSVVNECVDEHFTPRRMPN